MGITFEWVTCAILLLTFPCLCGVQDLQSEVPYHLLRLKVEVEENKFHGTVEDCRAELARQQELMSKENSEKIIREHKVFSKGTQVDIFRSSSMYTYLIFQNYVQIQACLCICRCSILETLVS